MNTNLFIKITLIGFFAMVVNNGWGQCYKLPFPSGTTYTCSQGNNNSFSHTGIAQYAFDFAIPIGASITASRQGVVHSVVQQWPNGNCPVVGGSCNQSCINNVNRIIINHGDGTYGLYLHLTLNGSVVQVGQNVAQGQLIGYSGNSGCSSGPHLHFMVMNSAATYWQQSIPISFCDFPNNGGVPTTGSSCTSGSVLCNLPPNLTSPSNSASNLQSPINFSWSAVLGVGLQYRIQISTINNWSAQNGFTSSNDCSSTVVVNRNVGSSTSFTWSSTIPGDVCFTPQPNTTYFWTVRAFACGVATNYSTVRSFTTAGSNCNPPTTTQTSPANGANFNVGQNINLTWSGNGNGCAIQDYQINLIAPDGSSGAFIQTGTTYVLPAQSNYIGTWQWRVRSRNTNGTWGNFTSYRTFTINQTTTNCTITLNSNPSAGGSTSGNGTFACGSNRTVTAIANAGYTFSHWSNNGVNVSNNASYTFPLSSNVTLVANFTQNQTSQGCSGGTQWPNNALNLTGSWQFVNAIFAGEYSVYNVTSGQTYIWSMCSVDGASCNYDSQLTLRNHSNGSFIAYSDDVCGNNAKITWTANFTGQVRVLLNQFNCQTNSTASNLAYRWDCGLPAQPSSISGSTSVCQGSWQTYSVPSVAGATSYTWSLPGGWSGSSSTNSISCTVGANSGTISVTANNGCGASPARTLSVSVTNIPAQPSSMSGSTSVCQGSWQTYSVPSVAGATSYTWSLPNGWSGSSSTNSISCTVGANSGTISVTANNGCGAGPARTLSVTALSTPSQPNAISGAISVCPNSPQTYSVPTVPGAASYTWSLPNGWSGSSTTNSISVTAGTAGGTISVTASNGCGTSVPRTLSVNMLSVPAQPSSISGSSPVCAGSSNTYSVNAVAGATSYTWTLPNGWTGTSTTNSITTTAGSSGGAITVVANNACGTSPVRTRNLNITPVPAQPSAISGLATVCQSSSQTYSVPSVAGATSYTWTLPNGWSGTSTTNSITCTAGASGGTISVTANNECGPSIARIMSVSIAPLPNQPSSISGTNNICAGTTQTYSVTAVAGVTYTWTLPNGWTGSSTTNSITCVVGNTSGTISVVANNSCGAGPARTRNITTIPIPDQPEQIVGSSGVCPNSPQTYSVPTVPGATSYTWSLPNGWSGSSTTNSISVTAGTAGGTISVTASNGCGTSVPRTLSVSMLSVPAQPSSISGSSPVCAGSANTYSVNAVAGATSYTWTLPNGWTGTSTTNSITTTAGSSGGTITVVANNACGTSPVRTRNLNITPVPAQPSAISGLAAVCQSSTQTYSVPSVAGATSYTWTLPNGWSGTSTTNSITCTAGAAGGTISVVANNQCGPSVARTMSVSIAPLPNQPSSISGTNNICAGTTQTYSVTAVAGVTYTWTLPNGWTGSSTTNSITCVVGSTGGVVSVTANNDCGAGPVRNRTINVNNIPEAPVSINGVITACEATQQNYSITAVPGATSYTWTLPNGWSGSSTTSSINATFGAESGNVTVTANNTCGSSSETSLSVVSNPLPGAIQAISGALEVCQSTNQVYTASLSTNASAYIWTIVGDANGSSTTNSMDLSIGSLVAPITLHVQGSNSCGVGPLSNQTIVVNPLPAAAGAISG